MFELFSRAGGQSARGSSCPERITEIPRCDYPALAYADAGFLLLTGKKGAGLFTA
jgi:hypothetical protein